MGTMGSRLLPAIAAVTLLIVVAPEEAATGEPTWNVASGCTGSYRISDSDATCMSASYSNSWSFSGAGYPYSVETECGDYGTVVVHANRINWVDYMANFTADNPESSGHAATKFRAFTCCADKSDLCHKQEVKVGGATGEIMVWNGSDYDLVDVSSHMERYEYCQENSDSIFCTANVSGDVNTEPTYSCGAANCTASDCQAEWEKSDSADESFGCNVVDDGFWIRHTEDNDAICTVRIANCTMIPNTLVSFHTPHTYADLSKLIFCSKVVDDDFTEVLLATWCPSDYTEVEIES